MPSVYTVSREQFEQRMRARRASTCLAMARSAVASGKMVEAIDRLEEACTLDPDAAEARLLLEELRSQEPPAEATHKVHVRSEMGGGWSHWVAAAIAICALAALAFFWPSGPSGTAGSADPSREMPASPAHDSPPAATGSTAAPGLSVEDMQVPGANGSAVGTGGASESLTPSSVAGGGSVAIKVTEQPLIQRPLPIVAASSAEAPGATNASEPGASGNAATAADSSVSAPRGAGSFPGPSPSVQGAAPAVQAANAPANSTPVGAVGAGAGETGSGAAVAAARTVAPQLPPLERVPVVDETPARVVPAPESELASPAAATARSGDATEASLRLRTGNDAGAIEGTLRRYADAYARLDAAAARAVWPTVDQRALARAFEGLESQGIVFEHCDVTVAGDDATAACNGRARYVPKVGSREPLVERRQWTFRLRKADAGWQITQAEAR